MAIVKDLRSAVRWIKNNPVYGLGGIAASTLGLIAGIPPAWLAISQTFNIPVCGSYGRIYYDSNGHFKNENNKWTEYQPTVKLLFDELNRERDYITLINRSPREDPRWASMLVRLPVCEGTAQWTYQNPEMWVDLFPVFRTVSPAVAEEQARWER
jgi:hypothetical protein